MTLDLGTALDALGWAVLHFLWQGAAIGLLAAVLLAALRGATPQARYGVACGAMLACFAAFLATFAGGLAPAANVAIDGALGPLSASEPGAALPDASPSLPLQSWLAWLWIGGVVCLALRAGFQCLAARRLTRRHAAPADHAWQRTLDGLRAELGVRRAVRLIRSTIAQTPMVVGWLSPVIVVPASSFTGLTPEQLRAVLTHELAHIRRHDHLVNGAQIVVETVLFFHPVTWWLSSRIRVEREHCCDDAACRSAPHPRVFAEALARLESIRAQSPAPTAALAATGGPLMQRITRILGTNTVASTPQWRTLVALAAGTAVAATGLATAGPDKPAEPNEQLMIAFRTASTAGADTDRLRMIYDQLIYPGSRVQQRVNAHLDAIEAELAMAVETGRLSAAEAREKLTIEEAKIDERLEHMFATEILGKSESEWFYEREVARLTRLVEAGVMTEAQRAEGIERVQRSLDLSAEYERKIEQMHAEIRGRLESGELGERDAAEKMAEFEKLVAMKLRVQAREAELADLVGAGLMTEAQAKAELSEMQHIVVERLHEPHDWAEIELRIEDAVERGEITRLDADRMYEEIRVKAHAEHREHQTTTDRLAAALIEAGVDRSITREVLGVMHGIMEEIKAEGEAFELDPGAREHLGALGLDGRQTELAVDLSRRVLARYVEREKLNAQHEMMKRRFVEALAAAGIPGETIPKVLRTLEPIAAEIHDEGEGFELHPRIQAHFEGMGLSEDQVTVITRTAGRIAASWDRRATDLERLRREITVVRAEIEKAVAAGDLSLDEAHRKLRELEAKLHDAQNAFHEGQRVREGHPLDESHEVHQGHDLPQGHVVLEGHALPGTQVVLEGHALPGAQVVLEGHALPESRVVRGYKLD